MILPRCSNSATLILPDTFKFWEVDIFFSEFIVVVVNNVSISPDVILNILEFSPIKFNTMSLPDESSSKDHNSICIKLFSGILIPTNPLINELLWEHFKWFIFVSNITSNSVVNVDILIGIGCCILSCK